MPASPTSKCGDPHAMPEARAPRDFSVLAAPWLRLARAGAFAVVRREADADDVLQDALLAAYEKLDTCRDPARFRAWLLQIVRRRAINWLASRKLRDVAVTDDEDLHVAITPEPPDVALRSRLSTAIGQLRRMPRQVLLLHDCEGWTHEEISARLGISVVMSRKYLFQARRQLRDRLSDLHPEAHRTGGGPRHAGGPSAVLQVHGPGAMLPRRTAPVY